MLLVLRHTVQTSEDTTTLAYVLWRWADATKRKRRLTQRARLTPNNQAVLNNLGAIARQKGKTDEAASLFGKAGSGPEVSYNKGLVAITQGNYGAAISNMSGATTANLALAKLLNGDASGAKTTLENANDDSAVSSYLLAICSARLGDGEGVKRNITDALTKDGTLREKAKSDLEFQNYRSELGL